MGRQAALPQAGARSRSRSPTPTRSARSTSCSRRYTELARKTVAGTSGEFATEFVLKMLKKRLFSSPAAFATTLEKHRETLAGRGKTSGTRSTSASSARPIAEARRGVRRRRAITRQRTTTPSTPPAPPPSSSPPSSDETARQIAAWATAAQGRARLQGQGALDWLEDTPQARRQVERRAGHHLHRVPRHPELAARAPRRPRATAATGSLTMYGGMDPDERERVKAAFQTAPTSSPCASCSPPTPPPRASTSRTTADS